MVRIGSDPLGSRWVGLVSLIVGWARAILMYVWGYVCMGVCMDVWMYGWMNVCLYVCMVVAGDLTLHTTVCTEYTTTVLTVGD